MNRGTASSPATPDCQLPLSYGCLDRVHHGGYSPSWNSVFSQFERRESLSWCSQCQCAVLRFTHLHEMPTMMCRSVAGGVAVARTINTATRTTIAAATRQHGLLPITSALAQQQRWLQSSSSPAASGSGGGRRGKAALASGPTWSVKSLIHNTNGGAAAAQEVSREDVVRLGKLSHLPVDDADVSLTRQTHTPAQP